MSRMGVLSIATLVLALGGAALADASRRPTSSERAIIVKTEKDSRGKIAIPRAAIGVKDVRISTVRVPDRLYARVSVFDKRRAHPDVATGVVRRLRGHWRLIDLGTSGAGCRTVPARVRADLKLTDCP
jgi:acyl dehydratase